MPTAETDVLIIGASQAGLAAGYYLKQKNVNFRIIGMEKRLGGVWRQRYDSLVLFTPRAYSSLPGLPLTGDPNGYAAKDEIADYLERYAAHFDLPVQLETEVLSLTKEQGKFKVHTRTGEYLANNVIVAAGPFHKPFVPGFREALANDVYQVHTSQYLNPSSLKDGAVLVVGAGNSGAQIAAELAQDREVYLSAGHKMRFLPLQLFGKSIFWWADKLGVMNASVDGKLGRFLSRQGDPIFGYELRALVKQGKIKLKPKTESARGHEFTFQDQSKLTVQNVIWATGFRPDYGWIRIADVLDDKGKPVHHRGVSPVQGLYFLGLPWQYTRGSALIGGVGRDAEYISELCR
ncbi:oxidoreductase [Paenibacillus oralis]|uniref:Oxidoreductase n=1 Tax=Paenibacillus oralis TaxID=2490856 RepID=A0A3P3U0A0_9BACL|nr:NAD(P)/FAD-dependent oxidoreductase [Paenibacillus oralis]RRJ63356.1 oxidoreductase [Paenibacillus oralis]